MSRNAGIKAGGTLVVFNEQDVPGEYYILMLLACFRWQVLYKHYIAVPVPDSLTK